MVRTVPVLCTWYAVLYTSVYLLYSTVKLPFVPTVPRDRQPTAGTLVRYQYKLLRACSVALAQWLIKAGFWKVS